MARTRKPIPSLRWWIGGLLFASTVINYIDRQTLSLLAPYLKLQYHWTNSDYANLAIAFRVAYSIGQTGFGKLMDRVGTRRGLTFTVICYSVDLHAHLARLGPVQLRDFSLSCWARASRRTGPPPPKRSPNGFRNASAPWPLRSSTADLPSAVRSRLSSCSGFIFAGDGVQRLWSPELWAFSG